MARRPLAEGLADSLEDAIVSGVYPSGSQMPNEKELTQEFGVSRPTVREAIKLLQSKGLLKIAAGRGTFVSPVAEWSLLDPVLLVARSRYEADGSTWSRKLMEARRLVEVGATAIAATQRTAGDLTELRSTIDLMTKDAQSQDVVAFVEADIRFHRLILNATRNSFIGALFDPLEEVLRLTRYQTSAHADVRIHAIAHHEDILRELTKGDAKGAADAMSRHIDQTESDFVSHVKDPAQSLHDFRSTVSDQ